MNNEQVAWMQEFECSKTGQKRRRLEFEQIGIDDIPLYTHPVKEQKCVVKDCENHRNEGGFTGDLCNPCHQFIANGEGVYSQAYRNVHPVKELTDEEIMQIVWQQNILLGNDALKKFARAILRKAQEK